LTLFATFALSSAFLLNDSQADNRTEFVNRTMHSSLAADGIILHLSCPHTSPQNGKAECMLRTLNNYVRTLLIHASMPPSYWAETLAAATYLLNRRPSSSVGHEVPYTRLFKLPLHMRTCMSLGVCATRIFRQPPGISSLLARLPAFFSDIPCLTRGIAVSTSPRVRLSSHIMLFSMRPASLSLESLPLPPSPLIFCLIVTRILHLILLIV
jgi:hypothetical protein